MTGRLYSVAGVTVLLVLTTGVPTATAQVARDNRFVISGDVGIQTTVNTRTDTVNFKLFAETGRFATTQDLGPGTILDAGFSVRVWKRLGVGLIGSYVETVSAATINAEAPHPFFFEFPRPTLGLVAGLKHRERAVHLQGQYWMPLGDRLLLTIFMGPTLFGATQDLVAEITTVERGSPFDEVDIVAHTSEKVTTRALGYNAGFDLAFFGLSQLGFLERFEMLDLVGVGFMLRFSRAAPSVRFKGQFQPALELGGTHAVGGLRLAF